MVTTKKTLSTVGRRKEAVAIVKLIPGKGESLVNKKSVDKYFPSEFSKVAYSKPFVMTSTEGKFHFEAKVLGGGKEGQLEALSLALARALLKHDVAHKPSLRANDLLTVDARVRQRRHIGTGGKARRTKQSPRR